MLGGYIQPVHAETGEEIKNNGEDFAVPEILPADLPGINISEARSKLCIGDEMLKEILVGFRKRNLDTVADLRRASLKNDTDTIYQAAHGLKGSAGNIGAFGLMDEAAALEKAAGIGDSEDDFCTLIDHLEIELNRVLDSLAQLGDPEVSEPQIGKIPDIDLAVLFERMADSLDRAAPVEVKQNFMDLKQIFNGENIDALEKQIEDYDYGTALETMKKLADEI